ncbi:hypothetical protein R6Q59_023249 [Mikania micrantha]
MVGCSSGSYLLLRFTAVWGLHGDYGQVMCCLVGSLGSSYNGWGIYRGCCAEPVMGCWQLLGEFFAGGCGVYDWVQDWLMVGPGVTGLEICYDTRLGVFWSCAAALSRSGAALMKPGAVLF